MEIKSGEDRIPDQCSLKEVKQLMAQQKVSQAELARRIGLSASYISQVFNRKKRLTRCLGEKILKALGSPHLNLLEPFPQKRRGRKRGSGYDCRPHLRFMARQVLAKGLSEREAAKEAVLWAAENGYTAVSSKTLRGKFGESREELLEAERRRQRPRRATPSSCSFDREALGTRPCELLREIIHPSDEVPELREFKKALEISLSPLPEDAPPPNLGEDIGMSSLKRVVGELAYSKLEEPMRSAFKTLQLASDPDFDPYDDPLDLETLYELVEKLLPGEFRPSPYNSPQLRQLRRILSQRDDDPLDLETLYELVEKLLPGEFRPSPYNSPQLRQLRRILSQRAKELSFTGSDGLEDLSVLAR